MKIEDYIFALIQIDGALWQVIGGLKAEALKKRMTAPLMQPPKLAPMRTRAA